VRAEHRPVCEKGREGRSEELVQFESTFSKLDESRGGSAESREYGEREEERT
jgi:hypothetical protein